MEEISIRIIDWLLGGGVGGVLLWFISGKVRRAEIKQREQSAYEQMRQELQAALRGLHEECSRLYQEVNVLNQEVINLNNKNGKLQHTIDKLTEAVELANDCGHRNVCPIVQRVSQLGRDRNATRGRDRHDRARRPPSADIARQPGTDAGDGDDLTSDPAELDGSDADGG